MKVIRVDQYGPPSQLKLMDVAIPQPGDGLVRVRLEAVGVNFIDLQQRSGQYAVPLPFTPGMEGAGVIDAIGPQVTEFAVGDRVAFAGAMGAYTECMLIPPHKLVKVPAEVDLRTAAAALVQGITAHYLTHSTFALKAGNTILVHAAAGGVGLMLVQVAKRLGARVIGTVSTPEKAALIHEAGADEAILYTESDFEFELKRLTDGKGADVVYDSVGKTTFEKSLNSLKPRGMMVLFGQSSGPVAPFDLQTLGAKGSLFITRPTMSAHIANRDELLWRTSDLFKWLSAGELSVRIDRTLPLGQAAEAHELLASRTTSGKILLDTTQID